MQVKPLGASLRILLAPFKVMQLEFRLLMGVPVPPSLGTPFCT